ncbi:MAG: ABC transporter substrate-binding protein [Actinomycetota bacterium]
MTVASVLAACTSAGSGEPASAPVEAGTVSVWVSGDPEETQAFADVAEAFEASQNRIEIDLVQIAERDDLIARLATAFAGGEPPDLFLMNYRYLGQFESKDVLEPVAPYLSDSDAFSEEDFFPEAMSAFQAGGRQLCMPQNVSSLVLYYNRDLFERAGVPLPPAEGWRWNDMVAAATELTQDTDGDGAVDVYGLGVDPEIIRVAPFVWSNGGDVVDDPARPTRFAIGSLRGIQALQAFLDLRGVAGVTPTDEEAESQSFEERFLDGTLAMMMESRKVVPSFRTITDFEWDVAQLPVHRRPATILHSDAYCMTAASEHKDQAWTFLEFALGPEGQRVAAATGRTVPSLRSVAESDAFLDPSVPPTSSQVFLDNIPFIRAVPHIETWPEIEDVANALLEEAYYEPGGHGEAGELVVAILDRTAPSFERANEG